MLAPARGGHYHIGGGRGDGVRTDRASVSAGGLAIERGREGVGDGVGDRGGGQRDKDGGRGRQSFRYCETTILINAESYKDLS